MILRHLAVCFGVEIDGINIDILKVLVWGAASPVSIGIYCDCFGSVFALLRSVHRGAVCGHLEAGTWIEQVDRGLPPPATLGLASPVGAPQPEALW